LGWVTKTGPMAMSALDTFPHNLPVDGEVANLMRTCYGETGVMYFGF